MSQETHLAVKNLKYLPQNCQSSSRTLVASLLSPPQQVQHTTKTQLQQMMQGAQLRVPTQPRPATCPGLSMRSGPLPHPSAVRQSPVPSRVASSPVSSEPVYRGQPMVPGAGQYNVQDLRKEMPDNGGRHSVSPYHMPPGRMEREPPDSRDRGGDLPQDLSKAPSGYRGNPRDFGSQPQYEYRRPAEDPLPRSSGPTPVHSQKLTGYFHSEAMPLTNRPPSPQPYLHERQAVSPAINRHIPPSTSPFTGMPQNMEPHARGQPRKVIPSPPPLINNKGPSPKLNTKSPPSTGRPSMLVPDSVMHSGSRSITQGTPVRIVALSINQFANMAQRQEAIHRQQNLQGQPRMPSGSITSGTPVNREIGIRGAPGSMEGPRMLMEWEQQQRIMMEQQMKRPPQQYPKPGMPFHYKPENSTRQTIRCDFETRQMGGPPRKQESQPSPKGKESKPGQRSLMPGYTQTSQGLIYLQPGQMPMSPYPSHNAPPHEEKPSGWPKQEMPGPSQVPHKQPSITHGTVRLSVISANERPDYPGEGMRGTQSAHSPRYDQMLRQQQQQPRSSIPATTLAAQHQEYNRRQMQERQEQQERENANKNKAFNLEEQIRREIMGSPKQEDRGFKSDTESNKSFSNRSSPGFRNATSKIHTPAEFFKAFAQDTSGTNRSGSERQASLSDANLIDAIIIHQINNSTEETAITKPEASSVVSSMPRPHGKKRWVHKSQQRPVKSSPMSSTPQSGSVQVSDSENSPTTSSMEARTPKSEDPGGEQKSSMTLEEHMTSIITMMDYGNTKPSAKANVLSQINGSPGDSHPSSVDINKVEELKKFLRKEKTTIIHARGILVGCAEAGKTTLLKRLRGQRQIVNEITESTRGLEVHQHLFFVRDGTLEVADDNSPLKTFIRINAADLKPDPSSAVDSSNTPGQGDYLDVKNSDKDTEVIHSTEEKKEEKVELSSPPTKRRKEDISVEVMASVLSSEAPAMVKEEFFQKILSDKEKLPTVSMLDFAGQLAYYACHQIYVTPKSFFILVLDMTKKFEDVVEKEKDNQEGSIFSAWTYK
ncbi:uncharacterized protein LOC134240185, partial [Saccostrea cucullata]|uniref:uncharacterized protein LOC134240185 n=1 Tax=Saccostrea cuccullata TaxID=36930 RepID=UPI002ED3E2D7